MALFSVSTEKAPSAIGPYSQAIKVGNLVFVSGQLPIDPQTGNFAGSDIVSQTRQVLKNLEAVVNEAGGSLKTVVKTTVLMKDMSHFVQMNEIYGEFFFDHKPARAAFEVARLPKDALVEIECVAEVL